MQESTAKSGCATALTGVTTTSVLSPKYLQESLQLQGLKPILFFNDLCRS
jgi:hypothetical protein